ncbi:uncharacterized protein LOC132581365 isoform X2 [Heteronotia binoei]|uniref:uncharacterized protein LOC132581365 isoform X2 n=1 Tax=Heteronotia binoei TaxID=13085 RepID=UPI00292EE755|nr:uncharacterized protein LOC132581365 isoform X2 [Heteronotia binoei]
MLVRLKKLCTRSELGPDCEEQNVLNTSIGTDAGDEYADWKAILQGFFKCQQASMDFLKTQAENKNAEKWDRKKFPVYQQGQDVSTYLALFETTCQSYGVPEESYVQILWSHAAGKLAEVLRKLSLNEAKDYAKFKQLALQRFALTENQLRVKFRNAALEAAETLTAYMTRLMRTADQWVQAEEVKTLWDLHNLIVKEQFLSTTSQEVNELLQDRNPKSLMDMAAVAEQVATSKACRSKCKMWDQSTTVSCSKTYVPCCTKR